jgi:hypothetical protein
MIIFHCYQVSEDRFFCVLPDGTRTPHFTVAPETTNGEVVLYGESPSTS